jgi:hypothetical protein
MSFGGKNMQGEGGREKRGNVMEKGEKTKEKRKIE